MRPESMVRLRVGALLVGADPFFSSKRDQIVALAARYAIPAVYEQRAFAEVGGLMSYGTNICRRLSASRNIYWPNSQR